MPIAPPPGRGPSFTGSEIAGAWMRGSDGFFVKETVRPGRGATRLNPSHPKSASCTFRRPDSPSGVVAEAPLTNPSSGGTTKVGIPEMEIVDRRLQREYHFPSVKTSTRY